VNGPHDTAEVVVAGGGVIGLAVAWRACEAGLSVTLADDVVGRGASWAAAGMLAPVTEVHYGEEALLRLNLAAARRYPDFVAALEERAGRATGYRPHGTVVVARDADDNAVLDDLFAFQQRLGLEVERLASRECRRLEPGLAPSVRGGILVAGDHQVDNRALVAALLHACRRNGVTLTGEGVAAVEHAAGRVTAVRLTGGQRLACRTVVVAAGAWSASIEGVPAELVPLRPVKGQLVHLRGPADQPIASRTVRGLEVYLVPRTDGRVVVGATAEERGFDTTVTAGGVFQLLRAAWELLPGIDELELTETVAGLRPGTPDNAPLIGPTGIDGLILATGHYRNGILLAPVTADAVVGLLTDGRLPDEAAPFTPQRFGGERGHGG
jgi:glycine oxidase